jgi:hypothetical protein
VYFEECEKFKVSSPGRKHLRKYFQNAAKIGRAKIIGPWKWWSTYGGASHVDFVHDVARVVLNLRCNVSATQRVNNVYKNIVGIRRCWMNNDRAEKLVYIYVQGR